MWEIYLQQIREEKELYDEEINSGASEKEIYELVTTAKREMEHGNSATISGCSFKDKRNRI